MFKFSNFKAPKPFEAGETKEPEISPSMPMVNVTHAGPAKDDKTTDYEKPAESQESLGFLGKRFLEGTSAHGLPRVLNGSKLRKAIWCSIFIIMVVVFVYQCQFLFTRFFSYPVSVSIEVKVNTNVTFPAVTVCNMNMMKKRLLMTDDRFRSLVVLDDQTRQSVQAEIHTLNHGSGTTSGRRRRRRSISKLSPAKLKQKLLDIARLKEKIERKMGREVTDLNRITTVLLDHEKEQGVGGSGFMSEDGGAIKWRPYSSYGDNIQVDTLDRDKRQAPGSGDADYGPDDPDDAEAGPNDPNAPGGPNDPDNPDNYEQDPNKWNDFGGGGDTQDAEKGKNVFENFEFHDYGFSDIENDYEFEAFMQQSQTDDFSDLGEVLKPSKQDLDNYGHQAKDLFVQCSWDKKNCSYKDFYKTYNPTHGLCYTFNHGKNGQIAQKTTKFGSQYGLRLTLNIEYEEYLGLFAQRAGVRIAVHDHDYAAFPEDFGISAAPGMETQIGVERGELSRKAHPHPSNCTDGDDYNLLYDSNYTSLACSMSCIQSRLRDKCGCYDKIVVSSSEPRCSITNATQEQCKQRLYYLYDNEQLGCDCPVPCSEIDWDTSVSSAVWPSDPYTYLLVSNLMAENDEYKTPDILERVGRNLVRIHIYISTRSNTVIAEDSSYPWDKLLADFGGLLGLFLGISACTAAELVEFLFDGSILLCCKKCKKKKAVGPLV